MDRVVEVRARGRGRVAHDDVVVLGEHGLAEHAEQLGAGRERLPERLTLVRLATERIAEPFEHVVLGDDVDAVLAVDRLDEIAKRATPAIDEVSNEVVDLRVRPLLVDVEQYDEGKPDRNVLFEHPGFHRLSGHTGTDYIIDPPNRPSSIELRQRWLSMASGATVPDEGHVRRDGPLPLQWA